MPKWDRLRSLIASHQVPCPLGDTVLVQEKLDGAEWHVDLEFPILTLKTALQSMSCCMVSIVLQATCAW